MKSTASFQDNLVVGGKENFTIEQTVMLLCVYFPEHNNYCCLDK